MAGDDDLAALLPEPPPPAPARREAAIGEAMRRFDGLPPSPVEDRRPSRPRAWRQSLNRPYAGAVVGAALIALVALPFAWDAVNQQAPISRTRESPNLAQEAPPDTAVATDAAGQPIMNAGPPAAPSPALQSPTAQSPAAPGAIAPPAAEPIVSADVAPFQMRQGAASYDRSEAPPPAPPPPPPPPPPPAPPPPAAFARPAEPDAASRAEAARSARSGLAAEARARSQAVAEREDSNIVVTAARKSSASRRGDWNACTVDDPARSLSACRRQVDAGAKGMAGRAAAHISDGLSRAWQGDMEGAIADFDKAIAVAPRSSSALLNRGLARRRSGDLDGALADLDQAVRAAPTARAYYQRSLLQRERGDSRRARADEDRAIALDSRYDELLGSAR